MGPIRSRAINSHLASASLTWEAKYKNLGSGLLINGCSVKPKYLTIASISIIVPIMSQYGNNASTLSRGESKWRQLCPQGAKLQVISSIPERQCGAGDQTTASVQETAKIASWRVTGVSEEVFYSFVFERGG